MMQGGGSLFLGTKSYRVGPGHLSVYFDEDVEIMQYHYFDPRGDGLSWAAENRLEWEDEWPVVGDLLSDFGYALPSSSWAIQATCPIWISLLHAMILVRFFML